MEEGQEESLADQKKAEKQREIQNNANTINNAADVAIATGHPIAAAVGHGVKIADKVTGGKSSELLGKTMRTASKISPGGKQIQKLSNGLSESGVGDKIGAAASMKNGNPKDVNALKNRGSNQGEYGTNYSRTAKKELGVTPATKSTTTTAEGEAKGTAESSASSSNKKKSTLFATGEETESDAKGSGNFILDLLMTKLKINLAITLAIGIGIFLTILVILSVFISTWEVFTNSITSFFGVSETGNGKDTEGLFDNEEFFINPETGGNYTMEELVEMLKKDSCSKITTWTKVKDWFSKITTGQSFNGNVCYYLRFVESKEQELEKKYPGLKMDRGLIISGLFYGYASQPNYLHYNNPSDVEDITNPAAHYDSLIDMLSDGTLTKDDVTKIIENSVADTTYIDYTWEIDDETDRFGNLVKSTGKCVAKKIDDVNYSLLRWEIFMRYGEDVAKEYDELIKLKKSYESSDTECNGEVDDGTLLQKVAAHGAKKSELDYGSIRKAQDALKYKVPPNLELFEQKAELEGNEIDVFEPYTDCGRNIVFDYKNGFAFINFPYFKQAIEDDRNQIKYDDVITPKEVEYSISMSADKKKTINEILALEDQDSGFTYSEIRGDLIIGANCEGFLTSPIDAIKVMVNDCNGRYLKTVSMKEYIMGVAYREVSDVEDDYVKSEMVAALSYALHRRNNYSKGNLITMRSGNCDQAFCPMTQGCHAETSNISCGSFNCTSYIPGGSGTPIASSALIAKYESYYDEISDFLIVKGDKIFPVHYVSSIQNVWKDKALAGMSFTQIIQETYESEGAQLVQCSGEGGNNNQVEKPLKENEIGNEITEIYNKKAPDKGKYYGYSYNEGVDGRNIEINPKWIENNIVTLNSNCPSGNWSQNYKVNKNAVANYTAAFTNMCKLLTNGVKLSNGTTCKYSIENFSGGGTFEQRKTTSGDFSELSYGLAQTWNYNKKYVINDVEYQPYGPTATLEDYHEFIKALGSEENCNNVNYILNKYVYGPANFSWGGNFGRFGSIDKYNGMYFRINY